MEKEPTKKRTREKQTEDNNKPEPVPYTENERKHTKHQMRTNERKIEQQRMKGTDRGEEKNGFLSVIVVHFSAC